MNIAGFLQNKDGVENGYLARCLHSMSLVVDQICVYDDCSTEDVTPLYVEYGCTVIYGRRPAFHRELYNKAALLQPTLRYRPEWIVWFDSDAVLGPFFEDRKNVEEALESAAESNFVRLFLHNLNLWRSP